MAGDIDQWHPLGTKRLGTSARVDIKSSSEFALPSRECVESAWTSVYWPQPIAPDVPLDVIQSRMAHATVNRGVRRLLLKSTSHIRRK